MDQLFFSYLHDLAGRWPLLDLPLIFLADYLPYLLVAAFVILIFVDRNKARRFYFIFLSALSLLVARGLITEIIRFLYSRSRPFLVLNFQALISHPGSAAFPSGHAVTFFVLAAIVFFMNRRWFYYFLSGAFLNALARVAVGVHWPLDVLAGAVIGVVTVVVLQKLLPKVKTY